MEEFMNVNHIVGIIPTLKVNNRNLNEVFYTETLGMKALLEESAFLSLGDQTGIEKLVLEEAPSMRTRKVEGNKKLARLVVKVENPVEIEGLLSKIDSIHRLYKGQNGYAFEILSPENDLILIHAEENKESLEVIEEKPIFKTNMATKSLSQFEISMEINFPIGNSSLLHDLEVSSFIDFIQAEDKDLAVENNLTWDLSMLKLQVKNFDIDNLRQSFASVDYFVPKSGKFFLGKDTNNVELWFEEV